MTIRNAPRPSRYATLCLLALLAALCHAQEARAQWTTSGTNTTTTNNVGVGTTTPGTQLEVRTQSGDVITRLSNAGNGSGALDLRYKLELGQHRMGLTDANGQWMFYTRYAASNVNSVGYFPGRVGIGTESPGYPLVVRANTNLAPLNLIGGTGNVEIWKDSNPMPSKAVAFGSAVPGNPAGDDIQLSTYNGTAWTSRLTVTNGTGNVGIATATPLAPLHVSTGTASGGVAFFQKDGTSNGVGIGTTNGVAAIAGVNPNYTVSTDLLINPYGGKVGIGTTAPASALHVAGDITVSGNINAKYQDVAEWVPSKQKLQAGTVVILDVARDNHVAASVKSYDTRVAGVVSAQPGISLGEAGEGKALVATTGRVRVKVDASRGAIRVGDLLVTSNVPGVAMRSKPVSLGGVSMHRPGTIIGKALESLASGTGEILVLLSLQ